MTKRDVTDRIKKAIKKLNEMDNKVYFRFKEETGSVRITCESRTVKGTCFGAYSYTGMFDEYKNKLDAYINCMLFSEMLVAATKLNDPNAYHNYAH